MKDVDARLIKDMGFPETVLIENAGRAVAEEACAFLGGAARKRIRAGGPALFVAFWRFLLPYPYG